MKMEEAMLELLMNELVVETLARKELRTLVISEACG